MCATCLKYIFLQISPDGKGQNAEQTTYSSSTQASDYWELTNKNAESPITNK